MDYFVGTGYGKTLDHRLSLMAKIVAIAIAIWLLNVLFVAIHEVGHTVVATSFGATIYNVYVSPLGLDGSTTHTIVSGTAETFLVLSGGTLATVGAIVIAYLVRFNLAVYVLGVRTVECLLNYTRGSDMAALLNHFGAGAYVLSFLFIGAILGFTISCVYRRYFADKSPVVRRAPDAVMPAPAA